MRSALELKEKVRRNPVIFLVKKTAKRVRVSLCNTMYHGNSQAMGVVGVLETRVWSNVLWLPCPAQSGCIMRVLTSMIPFFSTFSIQQTLIGWRLQCGCIISLLNIIYGCVSQRGEKPCCIGTGFINGFYVGSKRYLTKEQPTTFECAAPDVTRIGIRRYEKVLSLP